MFLYKKLAFDKIRVLGSLELRMNCERCSLVLTKCRFWSFGAVILLSHEDFEFTIMNIFTVVYEGEHYIDRKG